MNRIKIDIVSGFLGAGKTTFLNQLLLPHYREEKTAVLENEFGSTRMDEMLLSQSGVRITSVSGGCICCGFSAGFREALAGIMEEGQTKRLIIEPTGLAKLKDLLEEIRSPEFRDHYEISHCISIVDARNFDHRLLLSKVFFEDQIRNTACIFLSKTDSCEDSKLSKVTEELKRMNPFASVISTDWSQITVEMFGELLKEAEEKEENKALDSIRIPVRQSVLKPANLYESVLIPMDHMVSEQRIRSFFKKIQEDVESGTVLRGKGMYINEHQQTMTIDYVPQELLMKVAAKAFTAVEHNLCIIGHRMDIERIKHIWQDS